MTENCSKSNEFHVLGPPGTGKTTYLSKQIRSAADKHGDDGVLVVSFTRAAAAEIAARVGLQEPTGGGARSMGAGYTYDPDGGSQGDSGRDRGGRRIGTLHAICYHQLERPEIAETHAADWNESTRPDWKITGQGKQDEPEWSGATKGGDRLYLTVQKLRAKRVRLELWPGPTRQFYRAWRTWKLDRGFLDFTDLVEVTLRRELRPPEGCRVGIVDEAQDFTKLELDLIARWAAQLETVVLAYDDDQCQPAGTLVSVSGGLKVPIEQLDPNEHRVVSFDRSGGNEFRGRRDGFAFEVNSRPYEGDLLRIDSAGNATRCTPNHRWIVRWAPEAVGLNCVYLMRRGPWWRVGWCKLIRADGAFHLGHRARLEGADAAWVLKTFAEPGDASIYESLIASKYGIPQVMFNARRKCHYTPERIAWLFSELGGLCGSAGRCLAEHGRDTALPLYSPQWAQVRRGGATALEVRTANLLPEAMLLPADTGKKKADWQPFTLMSEPFSGTVWSLKVKPHELYIADGMLTHNSLYAFKGAAAEALTDRMPPKERIRVLSQSYRVPRAVHALADRWVHKISRRAEKEYKPRDFEGEVVELPEATSRCPVQAIEAIEADLAAGRSVMVLASCSFFLRKTISELRARGIPFHNPYRTTRGDWNPLKRGKGSTPVRLEAYLKRSPEYAPSEGEALFYMWTARELQLIVEHLSSDVLQHGAKAELKRMVADKELKDQFVEEAGFVHADHLEWFRTGQLDPFLANLLGSKRKGFDYAAEIARRGGLVALTEVPKVVIGTIHSVKGGEADCSPPDEPVLTTKGYVPIGNLNPSKHRLVSYTHHTDKIRRGVLRNTNRKQEGYRFTTGVREYSGDLVVVTTEKSRSRVTPNHRMIVRFSESIVGKYATYVMQRGSWWRTGICRVLYGGSRGQRVFGLGERARHEGASAAWVLNVHDSRKMAAFEEQWISAQFGLSMATFKPSQYGDLRLTEEHLTALHNSLAQESCARAFTVLNHFGRSPLYPLWCADNTQKTGTRNRFETRACNLIDQHMEIPTDEGVIKPKWLPVSLRRERYSGVVHSLDVIPHHHYISGGAVVHNSVYLFPDLSAEGDRHWGGSQRGRDDVLRLFYVGFTRARERLTLCRNVGEAAVQWRA